jgi:lysozyme family protein
MDLQIRSVNDLLIDRIIEREGSTFTDDPADRGGATKYGITQHAWEEYCKRYISTLPHVASVRDLDEPRAREFYWWMYVEPLAWIDDVLLRELMIDSAVNCGAMRATKWLQRAASCIAIDGVIGPETRMKVNSATVSQLCAIHRSVIDQREDHYINLCVRDPSQLRFLKGWMRRLRELRQ